MKNKIALAKKEDAQDIEIALNAIKNKKVEEGIIPNDGKKIAIIGGQEDFSGKKLKIQKSFFKNNQQYTYAAGTAWEDIDLFGKKNIQFEKTDFI